MNDNNDETITSISTDRFIYEDDKFVKISNVTMNNNDETITPISGVALVTESVVNYLIENSAIEEDSDSLAQIDKIFTELHESDNRINKDREDILRLGKETRTILTKLKEKLD